jgi:MFS family permease
LVPRPAPRADGGTVSVRDTDAGVLGGPLSGWIMGSMGGRIGLANWQWLFLLEGIPSMVMGLLAFKVFTDGPNHADFLFTRD